MTKVNPRINVGIIGTGFGRYGLVPAFQLDRRCEIVAIAASSIERAEAGADQTGGVVATTVDEMISAPEVAAIALAIPPADQGMIAQRALMAGKAVFAEKPVALNGHDARVLAETADEQDLANVVDFIFPELDTWRRAKEILDRGEIGAPLHMILDWRRESYDIRLNLKGWKMNREAGGGVLNHFGCHSLYYLEWFFGPLTSLSAHLSSARNRDTTGDTLASLSLQFASGLTGVAILSNAALFGPGHRLDIYGEAGTLQLSNPGPDPVEGFQLAIGTRKSKRLETIETETWEDRPESTDSRVRPVARLASRFLDWMETGSPTSPSFKEGARVQALIDAAITSDSKNEWVDVG